MPQPILPVHEEPRKLSQLSDDKATLNVTAKQLNVPKDELLDHPWKYLGYRIFSRWVGSEKSFLVVRQFSTLNARIILWLQDDISLLEQQLDLIERRYSQVEGDDHDNGSFRRDRHMERKIIMEKIYVALHKYSKFLSRVFDHGRRLIHIITDRYINEYAVLQNRPPAPKNDITSVRRWLKVNHPEAIAEEETRFIDYEEDLISVRPKLKSPVRRFFESSMYNAGFFPKLFQRQPRDQTIIDGTTLWCDDEKSEKYVSVCISLAGLVMFIVPFWALTGLKSSVSQLGLITGFVILFFAMVALGTTARPFESLGAAAA
jgi:hypothetical protein